MILKPGKYLRIFLESPVFVSYLITYETAYYTYTAYIKFFEQCCVEV